MKYSSEMENKSLGFGFYETVSSIIKPYQKSKK